MHQSWGQVSGTDFALFVRVFIACSFLCICFLFSSSRSGFFCLLNLHLFTPFSRRRGTPALLQHGNVGHLAVHLLKSILWFAYDLHSFKCCLKCQGGAESKSKRALSHSCTKFVFLLFRHDQENITEVIWVYRKGGDLMIRGAGTRGAKGQGNITPHYCAHSQYNLDFRQPCRRGFAGLPQIMLN